MYRVSRLLFSTVLASGFSTAAHAADPTSYGPAVGVGIGTLGLIGEVSVKATPHFVVRLNGNYADLSYDTSVDANDFEGSAKLMGAGIIGDWHPFAGSFRLSGGVRYHQAEFEGSVSGTDITVNGNTYTASEYGVLTASVENGNKVAPYLGFGWDSAHVGGSGFSLSLDLGVLYVGDPDATLRSTIGSPALQADLDAEVSKIKDDYGKFGQFWPVVSIAAKYTF